MRPLQAGWHQKLIDERLASDRGAFQRVCAFLHRRRAAEAAAASGEYIGVARFSAAAAAWLQAHHRRVKDIFAGRIWRDGTVFEKAYLIHLFQEMLEQGHQSKLEVLILYLVQVNLLSL